MMSMLMKRDCHQSCAALDKSCKKQESMSLVGLKVVYVRPCIYRVVLT